MADCIISAILRTLRPRRTNRENGNRESPHKSSDRCIPSIYSSVEASLANKEKEKVLEQGLSEVDDIRAQLIALQNLLKRELDSSRRMGVEVETKDAVVPLHQLVEENDALRRQLMERDAVIKALQNQLQSIKLSSSTA